jgi:hypothetical protein
VLIFNGDKGGHEGAVDAGLTPKYVVDIHECETWDAAGRTMIAVMQELAPKLQDGTIQVIVLDLAHLARLIQDKFVTGSNPNQWQEVANAGAQLFKLVTRYPGITVVANCQSKSSTPVVANEAVLTSITAKSVGGERSAVKPDLPVGIERFWKEHATLILHVENRRKKIGEKIMVTRLINTQPSMRFEAKTRASSKLLPQEDGTQTLRSILQRIYG